MSLVKSYRFVKISLGLADMLTHLKRRGQFMNVTRVILSIVLSSGNCLNSRMEHVLHGGGVEVTVWSVETLTASACKRGGLHNDATPNHKQPTTNGLIPSAWTTTVFTAALS